MARSREMDRLRAIFDGTATGTAAAVLIAGDAGVGKTRLTEELTAMATEKAAVVLTGRCLDAGETGLPYLPFAEALAQVPDRDGAVEAHPALARLLADTALPATADPEQDVGQLQLFDAVVGLLGELARQSCVVLVLEDLHWADGSTRRLLSFLLSRLRSHRLMIVGTYRSDDLHRRHPLRPLVAELVRLPAVERMDLAPLAAADSRAFVAALAEDRLPDDVQREVAERSEGNAFFAEELLAAYAESGRGIPATLVDVLLARVERLGEAAQLVVRVASVAGRRVPHARVKAVAELGDGPLEEALREAVQHHILVSADGDVYAFRHALVREAVYGDLLPGERVRLHATYADQLAGERGRGVTAELAHHSMESHALPRALGASAHAAKEAAELGAPAEALEQLERALKLWHVVPAADRPAGVTELSLLRRASWVAGTSGEPERAVAFARSAVQRADDGGDPEVAAETRRRLAKALYGLDGKEVEATEIIGQAWAMIAERPASYVQAWVLAVYAGIERRADRFDSSREWGELAVRTAREVGAKGAEADALATLAALDAGDGEIARSAARLHAAIRLSAEVNGLTTELRARFYLCVNSYELGLLDEAGRLIDDGVLRAASTGLTWSHYGLELRVLQLACRYSVGDWDGAEAAAEPPGHRVSSTVSALLAAVGALAMVGRGRFAEAGRLVRELRSDWDREHRIAPTMGGVAAEMACWQGRPEQAVAAVRDALDWERHGPMPWHLSGIRLGALGVAACADLAVRSASRRDVDGERSAVDEGVKLAERARTTAAKGWPRTGTLGPEGLAWLARSDAEESRLRGQSDPSLWRKAVDGFGYGAVYEQALCRWRLGEALLGVDRRDEAAVELRAAEAVAERLGARPLREAVRKLARRGRIALGAGDGAPPRESVDPFTPRERSVLGLVALGRTNRQVGEELFISEKTVSVHLTRVMAKLGAGNRAEAVAIAFDRGLLDPPSRENA